MKFTLQAVRTDGSKITYEFSGEFLPDILEHVTSFLQGTGFNYIKELTYEKGDSNE